MTPDAPDPARKPSLSLLPGDAALADVLEAFRQLTGREPTPEEIEDARRELEKAKNK